MTPTRYLVPAAHLVAISGLAFTLIVIVIARSPYTHGNLSPRGYDRTEIAHVGQEYAFEGLGLSEAAVLTGTPASDGLLLFFEHGCASCHGLRAEGGVVGPDLPPDISASKVRRETREGPEGMPAYLESALSDEALETIIAFLKGR